jgi:hypothetical protein
VDVVCPLIFKCQNNKEMSKILLTLNMFNIFSSHNLGRRFSFNIYDDLKFISVSFIET